MATTDLLVTTDSTNGFGVYDLTDPEAPVEVDSVSYDNNQVRSQAHNDDFSRFVLVGRNAVRTVAFDGSALTLEDEEIGMGAFSLQNRDVAVTGDDSEFAVVSYFLGGNGGDVIPGGVTLYGIDTTTGALTELDQVGYDTGPGRVALSVTAQ